MGFKITCESSADLTADLYKKHKLREEEKSIRRRKACKESFQEESEICCMGMFNNSCNCNAFKNSWHEYA